VRNISVVPVRRAADLRGQRLPLTFPLDYPDPTGEFYGYEGGAGPEGAKVASTKRLVHLAGFIASSLVALKAGKMVTSTRAWLQAYRDTVGDAWAPLLQALYRQCKEAWAYQIPTAAQERQALRDLCRQMVDLENHYLVCYRDYLLDEVASGERTRRRFAVQRLQDVVFPEE
jgi:hypothetical protein